jgi:hypothetical protein
MGGAVPNLTLMAVTCTTLSLPSILQKLRNSTLQIIKIDVFVTNFQHASGSARLTTLVL